MPGTSIVFGRFALLSVLVGLVAACDPITATVVGAGGAVGMGTAEERGLEGAVDDTKIRAQINDLWVSKDFDMFRKVTLNVMEGRVMLTGWVERQDQREEAVRLTWQVPGVREVYDEIQVTTDSGTWSDTKDTWIEEKLHSKLLFDSDIRNINYDEDVVNGVVYLLGIAQDQAEMDRVLAYARDISGVTKVVNHVVLKNGPDRVHSN